MIRIEKKDYISFNSGSGSGSIIFVPGSAGHGGNIAAITSDIDICPCFNSKSLLCTSGEILILFPWSFFFLFRYVCGTSLEYFLTSILVTSSITQSPLFCQESPPPWDNKIILKSIAPPAMSPDASPIQEFFITALMIKQVIIIIAIVPNSSTSIIYHSPYPACVRYYRDGFLTGTHTHIPGTWMI